MELNKFGGFDIWEVEHFSNPKFHIKAMAIAFNNLMFVVHSWKYFYKYLEKMIDWKDLNFFFIMCAFYQQFFTFLVSWQNLCSFTFFKLKKAIKFGGSLRITTFSVAIFIKFYSKFAIFCETKKIRIWKFQPYLINFITCRL